MPQRTDGGDTFAKAAGPMNPAYIRWPRRLFGSTVLLFLTSLPGVSAATFEDPLDWPAEAQSSPSNRPLLAVAVAGKRLVAVGLRGLIILSDDDGKTWYQSTAPVQSDLLAVNFPTPNDGWAVGHDGVILHTIDGGLNWRKQLDGRTAEAAFKKVYAGMGFEASAAQEQIRRNYVAGPTLPWLDVWFETPLVGYVVGAYGMLAATMDGGRTWEPWLHRIDNAEWFNLNAIRGIGEGLYIAGERGHIFRLDRSRGHFTGVDVGYLGSLFGIVGASDTVLVYGLRGTVFLSADAGEHWEEVQAPTEQTIVAGTAKADEQGFVLADTAGRLLSVDRTGAEIRQLPHRAAIDATGMVAIHPGVLAVTGLKGITVVNLNAEARVWR